MSISRAEIEKKCQQLPASSLPALNDYIDFLLYQSQQHSENQHAVLQRQQHVLSNITSVWDETAINAVEQAQQASNQWNIQAF